MASKMVSVYDILQRNKTPQSLQRRQQRTTDYRQIGDRLQDDPYLCRRRKYIKTDFPEGQTPPPPDGFDWRDYMYSQPEPGEVVWVWNGKQQRIDYLAAGVWWRGGDDVTHWRPILRAGQTSKKPQIQLSETAKNADKED